jgi:two-component system sensor histidine kinase KdpD
MLVFSDDVTRASPQQNGFIAYGWGVAAPVICTLIDWPLRQIIGSASILLIYLLGVFLVASRFGRGPSILASLLSAPAFAFFLAPPIFSLAITDLSNVMGLGIMLVVAHVTSNLVEKLRSQAELAAQRVRRAKALHLLSEALSGARNDLDIEKVAAERIADEFGSDSVLIHVNSESPEKPLLQAEAKPPPFVDMSLIRQMYATPPVELKNSGGGKESLYVPLTNHAALQGVLVIAPGFVLTQIDPEELRFFETFIGQIAQGLERVRLSKQANESSLQVESESLRNSLLSAISHDLRTPLTRILGAASALVEHDDTLIASARHEFTSAIQDEAQHMADLMSKILDMARLTSGKLILHREWNSIEEIVGSALARLDAALQEREVILRIPDTLPLVKVDAVLLQQVLINLIDNANKYTPSTTPIEISADLEPGILRLAVADRGPGIPKGQRDRLFEKFHRLNPESSQTGVGLGLALCKTIMTAHDGEITVRPGASGGSLFELTLPIIDQPLLKDLAENSQKSHDPT